MSRHLKNLDLNSPFDSKSWFVFMLLTVDLGKVVLNTHALFLNGVFLGNLETTQYRDQGQGWQSSKCSILSFPSEMHAAFIGIIDEQTNFPTCPLSWIIQQEKDMIKAQCQSVLFVIHLSVQFSSVAQSCPALCDPMNHSTPSFPVHHQFLEFTQTHAHRVGVAIQPSHPLSSPSPPAPNPSQHQGLFQWVSSLHQVTKVLEC